MTKKSAPGLSYYAKITSLRCEAVGDVLWFAWMCKARDVFGSLRKFTDDKYEIKSVMKWCLISNIIGANHIWRHRVKRVMNL